MGGRLSNFLALFLISACLLAWFGVFKDSMFLATKKGCLQILSCDFYVRCKKTA